MGGAVSCGGRVPASLLTPPHSWTGRAVLFLDVDGVLHAARSPPRGHFDPACMRELQRVLESENVLIVLSSTWRLHAASISTLLVALGSAGWHGGVAAATQDLGDGGRRRAEEVLDWAGRHPEVAAWAVVDDQDLSRLPGGSELEGRFVRTPERRGMCPEAADRLITILRGGMQN